MFSTTTIASSTSSPNERMSAKSVIRLMVWPASMPMARVMKSVSGMASATMAASRQPSVRNSRTITTMIETTRWKTSSFTASLAVLPSFRVTVTLIPGGILGFFQFIELCQYLVRDLNSIQLLPFGQCQGHGGMLIRRTLAVVLDARVCGMMTAEGDARELHRLFETVRYFGNVAEIDRLVVRNADHGVPYIACLGKEAAGLEGESSCCPAQGRPKEDWHSTG